MVPLNPVTAGREKRAADGHANAAAAALGVTVMHFRPGEKMKKKRHVDNQDIIDELFARRNTDVSDLTTKVTDLIGNLKGSPGKKKKDKVELFLLNKIDVQASAELQNKLN